LYDFKFLELEVTKDSARYKNALEQARHWHGLISVLINLADKEDHHSPTQQTITPNAPSSSIPVADELLKLGQLLQSGLLTQEEFQSQKAKLLNNS
jgi:hypothetical protein